MSCMVFMLWSVFSPHVHQMLINFPSLHGSCHSWLQSLRSPHLSFPVNLPTIPPLVSPFIYQLTSPVPLSVLCFCHAPCSSWFLNCMVLGCLFMKWRSSICIKGTVFVPSSELSTLGSYHSLFLLPCQHLTGWGASRKVPRQHMAQCLY